MASEKFPETIYVTVEIDGNMTYFSAEEEADSSRFNETTPIAMYKLVEVGEVTVTRAFASKQKRTR